MRLPVLVVAARRPLDVTFGYSSAPLDAHRLSVAIALGPHAHLPEDTMPDITFDAVRARLAELLRLPVERFTPETTLRELALDSFLMVEVVVDLQEEFEATLSQEGLREIQTLGELTDLLAAGAAEVTGGTRA